jgi:hypothetical protein
VWHRTPLFALIVKIIIHITCISLSLRRTSAPIHLTSILGVLGTQETSCIVIAGLLERDSFDLFLPEFDKPWVIHWRETCCCSTNLCTWRPNTIYKNRRVHRHQASSLAWWGFMEEYRGWKLWSHGDIRGGGGAASGRWWCYQPGGKILAVLMVMLPTV